MIHKKRRSAKLHRLTLEELAHRRDRLKRLLDRVNQRKWEMLRRVRVLSDRAQRVERAIQRTWNLKPAEPLDEVQRRI